MRVLPLAMSCAIALSVFTGSVVAQTTNATLVGSVVDPQASAIAGAISLLKTKAPEYPGLSNRNPTAAFVFSRSTLGVMKFRLR